MKIEVNIEKRYAMAIISLVVILIGFFAVYAYNSSPGVPSNFGHSINEVDGINCSAGEAVTRDDSGWSCVNIGFSSANCFYVVHNNPISALSSITRKTNLVGKTGNQVCQEFNPNSFCIEEEDATPDDGSVSNRCIKGDIATISQVSDDYVFCCS